VQVEEQIKLQEQEYVVPWQSSREWLPSLKVKGKEYSACIQSVLGYASEPWAIKVEDMTKLERTELMMVRWMCGVT